MRQILDIITLAASESDEPVGWRLVSATTNSPFAVEAEAFCPNGGNVDAIANAAIERLSSDFDCLEAGEVPERWAAGQAHAVATRLFKRSTKGIGMTDVFLSADKRKIITTSYAKNAQWLLSKPQEVVVGRSRTELGSVEGVLISTGPHYKSPAILVKDRLTGAEIWCRVPDNIMDEISETTKLSDVWRNRRVRVSGKVTFDKDGKISRVDAAHVVVVGSGSGAAPDVFDEQFTAGMTPEDYLNAFREGRLA